MGRWVGKLFGREQPTAMVCAESTAALQTCQHALHCNLANVTSMVAVQHARMRTQFSLALMLSRRGPAMNTV